MTTIPTKSRVRRGSQGKSNTKKSTLTGYKKANDTDDTLMDESHCIICADKILFAAYTPCQHMTCHRCSLRQRVLYEKDLCLICRTPNDVILISDDITKEYNQFNINLISEFDEQYKIYFTSDDVHQQSMAILDLKCTFKDCNEKFDNFKALQDHIKQLHNKFFCLICYNNKKAFIDELALYHFKALQTHQTVGDEKGFTGHPACKHCIKKRFYSEDELNVHIRDHHERCHICDQDTPKQADYYKNYDALYDHFRADHYVCTVQSCLDKKFVVFRDDIDLTAHMLKEHGNLTGGNKLIIGSGRTFQSQLSTYQNGTGSSQSRNRNNNSNGSNEADSLKTKKLRFEERAKHYLEYNNDKLNDFLTVNNSFKDNKISGEDLYQEYKQLFSKQSLEELVILLSEHAELYPDTNTKHGKLMEMVTRITKTNSASEFPILGGRAQSPTVNLHGWGSSPGSSKNSSTENFPVLQRNTNATKKPINLKNQPIRYTTITSTQPKKKSTGINTFSGDSNFTPSYLEQPSSSSRSSSSWGGTAANGSSSSRTPELSKFPPLEKKQTKKKFGRVNPVVITPPLEWGAPAPPMNNVNTDDDWGIPVTVKKKLKGRK